MKYSTTLSFSVLLLAVIVLFSSCEEDKPSAATGNVNVTFKVTYDGSPLVMNDRYTYTDDNATRLFFTKLEFYISDMILGNADAETELKELEFIDMTSVSGDLTSASEGLTLTIRSIPANDFNLMRFGIGVSPDYNNTLPTDYSSTHPLNQGGYWEPWSSFIFTLMEGRFDTDGDDVFDESLVYHIGTDAMYETVLFDGISVSVNEGETTDLVLELDLKDVLDNGTDPIDLQTEGFTHTNPTDTEQLEISTRISTNWKNAIQLIQ